MGLDMVLEARRKGSEDSFEVAYWRKANAIHKWFVDNVQEGKDDCGEYLVSRDALITLREACVQVLYDKSTHDGTLGLAEKLLPTKSGFFFGGTDYDDWYYENAEFTIESINKILEDPDFDQLNVYYSSSW